MSENRRGDFFDSHIQVGSCITILIRNECNDGQIEKNNSERNITYND